MQAERVKRAEQRDKLRKQIQSAQAAKEETDQAVQQILSLEPDILAGEDTFVSEGEIDNLLGDESVDQPPPAEAAAAMVDFEAENADDSATAMDNLRSVQCPFNKADVEFWFSQLEDQLTLIGVKKQWTKKIALVRFLPPEIQSEVKSLLKLTQTNAGADIYLRIKKQLLKMYGPKPGDAYLRAKNRVLSGTPSQLGKLLVEDLCPGEVKLEGCHCNNIIWGMFREKLPVVVRNHIADMPFNFENYEAIFDKADQVWESNRGPEPATERPVAAVTPAAAGQEVAAVQKNRQRNKNRQGGQSSQGNQNQGQSQNQNKGNKGQKSDKPANPKINDDPKNDDNPQK